MHPSLLYDATVREHELRLAEAARRHELALRDRTSARAGRRSVARTAVSRVRPARRRTTAPSGAPAQRPAATERPAAGGHVLAA